QGAHTPSPGSTLTPLAPGAYSERVEFGSPGGTAHAALSFAPQILALSVLALGCKTGKSFDRTTEPGGRPLSRTTTGSLIIKGRALSADPGRTVLDAIRHQMPQLRIAGWTQYTRCPLLEMRGKDSVEGTNNPD